MLTFFKTVGQTVAQKIRIHNLIKQANNLRNNGEPEKALNILEKLTEKNPTDVNLRHATAMLQKELNKKIKLPDISQKSNKVF